MTLMSQSLHRSSQDVASLKRNLAAAPQPAVLASLRRELRVLKKLHYNTDGDDGDDGDDGGESDGEGGGGGKVGGASDLEALLLNRVKSAESDLLKVRRDLAESAGKVGTLGVTLSRAEGERDRMADLVEVSGRKKRKTGRKDEKKKGRALESAREEAPCVGVASIAYMCVVNFVKSSDSENIASTRLVPPRFLPLP